MPKVILTNAALPGSATQISPTTPGESGVYETLAPAFQPGYHVVFQNEKPLTAQPKFPPAFCDPRGVLPSGMAPASMLSYQIVEQIDEIVVGNNFSVDFLGMSFGAIVGQEVQATNSIVALVAFEGHDVVDLPTKGLPKVDGGIQVPNNVYRPIYAGTTPFIGPGDSLATKAALEFLRPSPGNLITGIAASANPPLDSLSNVKGIFPRVAAPWQVVDTASNVISLNGNAKYITYTALDVPLYRDVIFINSSAIAQGPVTGPDSLLITFAGPYALPVVSVLRYAWVNFNAGTKLPAAYQWRLAESYGINPDKSDLGPSSLLVTPSQQADQLYGNRFAYDLNDASPDISVGSSWPPRPAKTGYGIAFATAMSTPKNALYDVNKKFVIIPYAKTAGQFNQSDVQVNSVTGLSPGVVAGVTALNHLTTTRNYTSPSYQISGDLDLRLGFEYALVRMLPQVFTFDNAIILAATTPTTPGATAFYDPCIEAIVAWDVENGTVVERIFDDKKWTLSKPQQYDSPLSSTFLIGESSIRSQGYAVLLPPQTKILSVGGTSGQVAIPSQNIATAFSVNCPNGKNASATLQLFAAAANAPKTPLFEAVLPSVAEGVYAAKWVAIPPIAFTYFNVLNPGNSSINGVYGVTKANFLAAMSGVSFGGSSSSSGGDLDRLSAYQLNQLLAESFPLPAASVSGTTQYARARTFMSYADPTTGSINMAYRSSFGNPMLVVRDVCLRPNEGLTADALGAASPTKAPEPVSMPFLLSSYLTNGLYLFYGYKNRVVMKAIPVEIFTSQPAVSSSNTYDIAIESKISNSIQKIIPVVAYDGGLQDVSAGMNADKLFGTVKFPPKPGTATDQAQISSLSACVLPGGQFLCFVQDGPRIRVRLSGDNGSNWSDVFLPTTLFLPPNPSDKEPTDGAAPMCFTEKSQDAVMVFFVADSALLAMRLPSQIFLLGASEADAALSKMKPQVIYGMMSDDLKARGIVQQSTVVSRQKSNPKLQETVSPHRIAIARLRGGHLRLFFLDQQGVLRSLISTDGGTVWQTEAQFLSPGANKQ